MAFIPLRHGKVTDLADGSRQRPLNSNSQYIEISKISRDEFNDKPANHAFIKNKSDQLIFIKFDGSDDEKYPMSPGDNLTMNPIDNFQFTDIEVENDSGATATGDVYITIGWLYG